MLSLHHIISAKNYFSPRFGFHGPDFREENTTAASIISTLADNSAKNFNSFGLSMMSNITGGLPGYTARLDTILSWCLYHGIPVLTMNKWANMLYDSVPNPFVNVMPLLQKDLNKNGIPDAYTGPFSSFDTLDGVAFSANRSYARNSNGTMTAVTNLGGLEKGNNIFYMSTKGFTGDSVRVTFTFIESNSSVVWMAPANTADWTQQSKVISIPAGVSRMSLSFAAVKRNVPGNIKISGMQLFLAGVQKKESMMATHPIENAQEIALMPLAYPNPFEDKVYLKDIDFSSVQSVQLIDYLGKEVAIDFNKDEMSLALVNSAATQGIYFLKIRLNNGDSKIIKLLKS